MTTVSRRVRRPGPTTVAAGISALGGTLFGYDTGVISGVLPTIAHRFDLTTPFDREFVVAILLAGAAVGATGAGRVADTLGRKRLILLISATFVVGLLAQALAPAWWVLVVARFVVGLGVGAASFAVPLYIGEIAPPAVRGRLVSLNQLCITIGILVSELVAYFLESSGQWRLAVGLALIPAVALGIGMLSRSESPAWLLRKGREDDARRVLMKYRDVTAPDDPEIEKELREIRETAERKAEPRVLLTRAVRPALVVAVVVAVCQQVTGINTVIYYAPTLLEDAGLGSHAALLGTVLVGLVNVLVTIVALQIIDRLGRRPLLIGGTIGMLVGLVLLIVTFAVGGSHLSQGAAVLAVVGLCVYVGSFAIGLGPIAWLLIGELFPLRARGQGAGVATTANWLANLVVAVSYLTMLSALGRPVTFGIYAVVTLFTLWFLVRRVPETAGRSLASIERDLGGDAYPTSDSDVAHTKTAA